MKGRDICGVIGCIFGLFSYATQAPAILKIYKDKKVVETFQFFPYYLTLLNCLCWCFYGLPFVHPHSYLILIVNGIGVAVEVAYLLVFFMYSTVNPGQQWTKLGVIHLSIVFVFFGGYVLGTMVIHDPKKRMKFSGILCDIFGALLCLSPFVNTIELVTSGNAEHMPLLPSIINILNGICWIVYASAFKPFDGYVLGINSFGATCGATQVLLYWKFRNGNHVFIPKEVELRTWISGRG